MARTSKAPKTVDKSARSFKSDGTATQVFENTMSGYGSTRADSVGYTPPYPYAYKSTGQSIAYRKKDDK